MKLIRVQDNPGVSIPVPAQILDQKLESVVFLSDLEDLFLGDYNSRSAYEVTFSMDLFSPKNRYINLNNNLIDSSDPYFRSYEYVNTNWPAIDPPEYITVYDQDWLDLVMGTYSYSWDLLFTAYDGQPVPTGLAWGYLEFELGDIGNSTGRNRKVVPMIEAETSVNYSGMFSWSDDSISHYPFRLFASYKCSDPSVTVRFDVKSAFQMTRISDWTAV